MPRTPRIRSRRFPHSPSQAREAMTRQRRRWLSKWKEFAVQRLPSTAPPAAKADLRQAVEMALAGFGPEDSPQEVQDIVTAVAQQVRTGLDEEEAARKREEQKKALLDFADTVLGGWALNRLPVELAGEPRSDKRRHVLATLRRRVRATLSAELSGEESTDDLIQKVQEELATWVVENNPSIDRRAFLRDFRHWAVAAGVTAIGVASQIPQVRDAIAKGLRAVRARLAPWGEVVKTMMELHKQSRQGPSDKGHP